MTGASTPERFTPLFDRAALASVQAKQLIRESAAAVARARATVGSSPRVQRLARETRDYWATADVTFNMMRRQVLTAAVSLREAGLPPSAAASTIRGHLRFLLYDGGFCEGDVEPLIERATTWVDEVFVAA